MAPTHGASPGLLVAAGYDAMPAVTEIPEADEKKVAESGSPDAAAAKLACNNIAVDSGLPPASVADAIKRTATVADGT